MLNKKFVYVLNYVKINKAAHKNNPWTHSPKQSKKSVLTAAAYFKVDSGMTYLFITRTKSRLKRFIIEVLIDFINFAIIFFNKNNLFQSDKAVN